MGAVIVVGTHWGDEAKGKLVDIIGQHSDAVVRYNGGPNAGHTVIVGAETYKLHLIPSGVLNPDTHAVLADGVVISPAVVVGEIEALEARGISLRNLHISQNAHVILPYHVRQDILEEAARGVAMLGTTQNGVGPCYADKSARAGLRMGDLVDESRLRARLGQILPLKNALLATLGNDALFDVDTLVNELAPLARRLAPFVEDTTHRIATMHRAGARLLFEGAQATLLDLDSGTYPYVTSSHAVAGGACLGTGIGPTAVVNVIGVVKGYTSRVGEGTFPTELLDNRGERIRVRGHEFGTRTGRPRRCGWLDLFALTYSVAVNGLTGLCLGHLDVLAGFPTVGLCVGYTRNGTPLDRFPAGDVSHLDGCAPILEELEGWPDDGTTERALSFDDLHPNARAYVRRVERYAGVPVQFVSVGPMRAQTFAMPGAPTVAELFARTSGATAVTVGAESAATVRLAS